MRVTGLLPAKPEIPMFERLTDRARKVMALANQEAQRFNHEYIGTEHILLGLVKEGSGVGANVLKNLDIDLRKVRLEVEKLVKSGPEMVTMGKLPQTPRAKKVIEYAIEEARNLNHNYVGTEHLLLGLLREHDGVAAQVLMNLGLKLEEVRDEVLNLLGAGVEPEEQTPEAGEPPAGEARAGPVVRRARARRPRSIPSAATSRNSPRQGELDPVIGRSMEIERLVQVLCRRTKNNPVLLGEAGVGKTAIVEGLAQPHRRPGDPRPPLGEALVVLDLGDDGRRHQVPRPVRGTDQGGHERGATSQERHPLHRRTPHAGRSGRCRRCDRRIERPQARPRSWRDPVRRCDHLRRVSQVHRKGCGARASLPVDRRRAARRPEQTIEILKGIREKYETHHKVKITDQALRAAVELSGRYISASQSTPTSRSTSSTRRAPACDSRA